MIDYFNIYKQDKNLLKKIKNDFDKIIKSSSFILGSYVNKFEKTFSNYTGSKYVVSCANGTDAIFLAIKALNLPNGSEVIAPAMTYCSTIFSILNSGLKPILVDINYDNPLINTQLIEKKITHKTSLILPVHLHGSVVDILDIKKILIKYPNIKILDDCAQAHGSYYCQNCKLDNKICCKKGKLVGNLSDASAFSFYPGKNLGAYGDGGAVTTNNQNVYKKLIKLRNLGSLIKFKHEIIGYNSRLDTLQSAVLLRKIKYLNINNNKRRSIADFYNKNIINKSILLNYSRGSSYHQYAILSKNKKKLKEILKKNSIPFGEHYPISINKLDALKKYFKNEVFPNAENFAAKAISLPIDPNLNIKQLKKIVRVINTFEIN